MSLISGVAPGNDAKFYEDKVVGFRNFANKLWNIGRFIQMQDKTQNSTSKTQEYKAKTLADKWIVSRLNNTIKEVTGDFDNYRFSLAAEKLYEFAWHELADWYVEIAKKQGDENTYQLLTNIYLETLKLLHPFMPFITETIFQSFEPKKMLMVEKWPSATEDEINAQTEQDFKALQDLVTAIRSWRKEKNIEPKEILRAQIAGGGNLVTEQKEVINYLCRIEIESVEELAEFDLEVDEMKVRIMI
jgi:valyl-tRNA synthetase